MLRLKHTQRKIPLNLNNYKTYKTYKQQVFDVDADIIPYLKNHIKKSKLLPTIGQGKYLFGSNDDKQQNSTFRNKLKDVYYVWRRNYN